MPDPLQMFIPLRKADAARRLIYGYATAELPDKSGEICDYASTKPFYEQWSAECAKASGGKSLGNLRAMHGKIAAGKISSIAFNDDAKRIEIAAKIVDDDEWRKIEEGVYTGFSQGGAYVKRWPDPDRPEFTRYTASPTEISLVDLPCLPEAGFELVKADGVSVTRAFIEPVAKAQAAPDAVASALRDWLAGNVTSDAEAAETIADFFDALQHDLNADPIHDAPLSSLLARLKAQCIAALQPRAAQKYDSLEARLEKLAAQGEAARQVADDLAPRLAELAERVSALEAAPAQPVLMPGFAPVSKSAEAGLEDLAAELARLSPEQASLVLIKAAQTQPKRFG
ncbi:hypothetical protein QM467_05695 [Rhodoblastus sp. 17X3]|uniref:hypothetical protein n=1 Tax=Rhodoblastus sp. 17X3 TaxID=3047026 RepID=UPI0024B689CA|nr:hypothetical protein [Rhodoblastus sp. 17X3]MDI9847553.1 hypothetical protein [Rhodoblastus sp. 17X3]